MVRKGKVASNRVSMSDINKQNTNSMTVIRDSTIPEQYEHFDTYSEYTRY